MSQTVEITGSLLSTFESGTIHCTPKTGSAWRGTITTTCVDGTQIIITLAEVKKKDGEKWIPYDYYCHEAALADPPTGELNDQNLLTIKTEKEKLEFMLAGE